METITQNLINQYCIQQGSKWHRLEFLIPGDWTSFTPEMEIRKIYDSTEVLATAKFLPLRLEDIEGEVYTSIEPYIPANVTELIPIPNKDIKIKGIQVGETVWVYDIKLNSINPEDNQIIFRGVVQVNPMVTR